MPEVTYQSFELDERERHITRAEVMHELNNPANYSQWSFPMITEQSGLELFVGIADCVLREWTDDILEAFRINKAQWSERIIDPQTGVRIDAKKAATIDGDLSEALSRGMFRRLSRTATNGYGAGAAKLTLELEPSLQVDLTGSGELWIDPSHTSSVMTYSAMFRKVA